ncbi:hypothetical protein Tco_0134436 [Tanacetum coccineum]
MYVRAQTPISLPSNTEVAKLLAIPTPPPSPLSPLSSPLPLILSPLPQILSPPLPTPSTFHPLPSSTPPSGTPPFLPIPLPTSSPHLLLPSTVFRAGVSEVTLPPRKRLCIALGPRYEGTPVVTDVAELSQRMTDFVTTVRHDTDEIYGRLDDAQDDILLMSGRLNMLYRDRCAHARIALLMERKDRLYREAWGWLMDVSDTARFASSRPCSTGTACGDTETDEYTADTCDSTTGSAGTRWRSSTARDTRGGR